MRLRDLLISRPFRRGGGGGGEGEGALNQTPLEIKKESFFSETSPSFNKHVTLCFSSVPRHMMLI